MLAKLMKYDLRSCIRRFGGLWIAGAALAILTGFSLRGAFDRVAAGGFASFFFNVLPPMLLFGVYIAMAVLALVFICERFYRGLLGDEGYLMFTLPVSISTHIGSKTLSAMILEILSGVIAVASGLLLLVIYNPSGIANQWRAIWHALTEVGLPACVPWLIVEMLILFLVVAATETLKIYASISIGHLAKKHRALFAVLSYIGINVVLNSLAGFLIDRAVDWKLIDPASLDLGIEYINEQWVVQGAGMVAGTIGMAIAVQILLGVGFFFLTRYILKNKLNLE